jgi:hypothetical protein
MQACLLMPFLTTEGKKKMGNPIPVLDFHNMENRRDRDNQNECTMEFGVERGIASLRVTSAHSVPSDLLSSGFQTSPVSLQWSLFPPVVSCCRFPTEVAILDSSAPILILPHCH